MKPNPIVIVIAALFALLTVATSGCKPQSIGTSSIWAGNGDRSVNVSAEGPAFVSPQPDRLIITLHKKHELVIEKERLLLDGKETAKVPPEAKKFEVILAGGSLTVKAEDAEILKTTLAP